MKNLLKIVLGILLTFGFLQAELLEQKGVYERLYMMQFVNQEMKIDRNEED